MLPKFNNVLVVCPGEAKTVGLEALHQLVSKLNNSGQPSSIVYFPFKKNYKTIPAYLGYSCPIAYYQDIEGDLIIFPKIITTYAMKVKNASAGIWWMSVNNFTCIRYANPLRDKVRYIKIKNLFKGLRPLGGVSSLKNITHFAQSFYAVDFLKNTISKAIFYKIQYLFI